MVRKTLERALSEQINQEWYSAYLYLSMSAWCEENNLPGFASWLRLQATEELGHGMKLFDHVTERGGRVVLKAIDQPPATFASPLALFRQALEHEQKVTGMINRLYEAAVKEKDYPAQVLLQWFITEQVEEEKSATEAAAKLELAGKDGGALLLLDSQFGARPSAE